MQSLRIEQRRVRFALISAVFAEIKALYQDVAHLDCLPFFIQQAFKHPLNRKQNCIHLAAYKGNSLL